MSFLKSQVYPQVEIRVDFFLTDDLLVFDRFKLVLSGNGEPYNTRRDLVETQGRCLKSSVKNKSYNGI